MFANNKDADQPAHPRSLISAFTIRFLESTISSLLLDKVQFFLASLCSWGNWFESRFDTKDRFSRDEAHMI